MPQAPSGQPRTKRISRRSPRDSGRKARILSAARQLLVTQGIEHFSVAEVAALAGVSKASVHYYFAKTEDMVRALAEQLAEEELAFVERATVDCETGIQALCAAVRSFVAHYACNLDAFRILYVWPQLLGVHATAHPLQSPLIASLVASLRRDQARGALARDIELDDFVLGAWSSAHGLVSITSSHGRLPAWSKASLEGACQEITQCLERAVVRSARARL